MNTKIVVSSLCGAAALAPAVATAATPAAPAAGADPATAPGPVTGVSNAVAQVLSTDAKQKLGTAVKHADKKRADARARAAAAAAPSTSSTGSGAASGGAGSSTLQAIAQCESSGDPGARSGPYGGLYQFDAQTWASVGGSGDPASASPQEQTMRAEMLMQREGMTPWPVCGAGK